MSYPRDMVFQVTGPRRLAGLFLAAALIAGCATGPDSVSASTTTSGSTTTTQVESTTSTSQSLTTSTSAVDRDVGALLVMGDWGAGTEPEGAVAGAMQRYAEDNDVAAILTTGDNFYSDDAEFLMQPYGWAETQGLEWWITWGNHDVESDSRIAAVNGTFGDPPRWELYPWGSIDVIVLDSNQVGSAAQAEFLNDTLAGSSRPTIVTMHHPPYSCSRHGSTTKVIDQIVANLDDDVILVLSGHDHAYQRFEKDEVGFVVTGGGGGKIYPLTECPSDHPNRIAGAELHHFLVLEQDEGVVVARAMDVNGSVFDETSFELP